MMMCTSIFGFLLFSQHIVTIAGWGSVGHGLVARLAQSQLTPIANDWVQEFLPSGLNGDLSRIASWPDLLLYANSNPLDYNQWQWSRELHYINTPDWNCSYSAPRDCVHDRCIEGALKNYSSRLVDGNCDYAEQQQAFFFLVHFLGDVHQPLHCGFESDFGGNNVKGFFLNESNMTNLHSVWDDGIIDTRIHRYFQSDTDLYYNYLQLLMLNQSSSINETGNDFPRWINESVSYVCTQVYFDDGNIKMNASKNFTLGEDYFNRNWPLVDQRLTQAGRRLGVFLNQLSERRTRSQFPPDVQALVLTLCAAIGIGLFVGVGLYLLGRRTTANTHRMISEES